MEDVQDGIKKSIQDGVEEDPEFKERLEVMGKSFLGLVYVFKQVSNPTIQESIETSTDSTEKTESISIILGTSVT